MRLLDQDTSNELLDVAVYLTPSEVQQMVAALTNLLNNPAEHHVHLNDDSYSREITISIYTDQNLNQFDERSRRLIVNG